eukprot:680994-Rhodomonas_salina.4
MRLQQLCCCALHTPFLLPLRWRTEWKLSMDADSCTRLSPTVRAKSFKGDLRHYTSKSFKGDRQHMLMEAT